jgi:hypothetical protein
MKMSFKLTQIIANLKTELHTKWTQLKGELVSWEFNSFIRM